nr:hypothetical protein [Tanacetum cinerariifolium]
MAEKKVITKPIDYSVLNQLSKDFETRFVPQTELSAEQAFWSRYSVQPEEPNFFASTTIIEVPKELPRVSLRNTSFSQVSAPTFAELFEINDLKAQSQAKDTVILKLREKLQSLTALKLRKNRTVHNEYIRHTQEEASTLREIVESERLLNPLNTSLDYA